MVHCVARDPRHKPGTVCVQEAKAHRTPAKSLSDTPPRPSRGDQLADASAVKSAPLPRPVIDLFHRHHYLAPKAGVDTEIQNVQGGTAGPQLELSAPSAGPPSGWSKPSARSTSDQIMIFEHAQGPLRVWQGPGKTVRVNPVLRHFL